MSDDAPIAFSRPLLVDEVPDGGRDVHVTATEAERTLLAQQFKLPEVLSLEGRLRVTPTIAGMDVTGTVEARVVQICVVTVEPFEARISESVAVSFSNDVEEDVLEEDDGGPAISVDLGRDPPDPIVNGRIDLGLLAAEFMALGLDPHPRKPDAAFDHRSVGDEPPPSPFAVLATLKKPSDKAS